MKGSLWNLAQIPCKSPAPLGLQGILRKVSWETISFTAAEGGPKYFSFLDTNVAGSNTSYSRFFFSDLIPLLRFRGSA